MVLKMTQNRTASHREHPYLEGNWEKNVAKCCSSLSSSNQCINEIYGTLTRGKFSVVDLACYKSIAVINHKCWPKMFPLNPLFPPFLKSKCARSASRAAPKPRRIWSCLWIQAGSSLAIAILIMQWRVIIGKYGLFFFCLIENNVS